MDEILEELCNTTLKSLSNCSVLSNGTSGEGRYVGPEPVIVPLCFGIVFVVGLLGNSFLLYYILRKKRLDTLHNCYVVNLAIGDILMITVAMPFVSTIYTNDYWVFGEVICKLSEFAQTLCTAVTIFTITALSIERYFIVIFREPTGRTQSAVLRIFFIWVVAFVLAIPDLVSAYIVVVDPHEYCLLYRIQWGEEYAQTLTMLKFLALFVLPLLVMLPLYFLMAVILFSANRNKADDDRRITNNLNGKQISSNTCHEETGKQGDRKRQMVAILVLCLVFVFVFCWLPRHIFLIWFHFNPGSFNLFWHVFKIVGFCLMFVNSGINPLVFLIFDSGFRKLICGGMHVCTRSTYQAETFEDYTSVPKQTFVMTDIPNDTERSAV